MVKFYRGTNFGVLEAKYHGDYIKWFIKHLDDSYHVLLEFTPLEGRQIDILILNPNGFHCIEVKDYNFTEINQNGKWKYKDRITDSIRTYNRPNPYKQVRNQTNSIISWLFENKDKIFEKKTIKGYIKVYPYLLAPHTKPAPVVVDPHPHIPFCNGPEELTCIFSRPRMKAVLKENASRTIVEKHRLSEISTDDLLELTERSDWWMEEYYREEYYKSWGHLYAQNVDLDSFEEVSDSFIDLKLQQEQIGQRITQDQKPLSELRSFKLPFTFSNPFFNISRAKEIIDYSLYLQGADVFEKPYAEWKAKLNSVHDFASIFSCYTIKKDEEHQEVNIQNIISFRQNYTDFTKGKTWIFGSVGSGKSFCARKLWGLLFNDFITDESSRIPLLLDVNYPDFEKNIRNLLQSSPLRIPRENLLVRCATQIWGYLDLPQEELREKLDLILIIDSVENIKDLSVLNELLSFIINRNILTVFFCRDSFRHEIQSYLKNNDFIYNILPPDNTFVNNILSDNELKQYGSTSIYLRQLINSPLHLKFFKEIFNGNIDESNLEGSIFLEIIINLIKESIKKNIGTLVSKTENKITESLLEKISSFAFNQVSNQIPNKIDLSDPISIQNIEIIPRVVFESSGLLSQSGSFRHQLFQDCLISYYILLNDIEFESIKIKKLNVICKYLRDLFLGIHVDSNEQSKIRIQSFLKKYVEINPFVVAEIYDDRIISTELQIKIINLVFEKLRFRRRGPPEIFGPFDVLPIGNKLVPFHRPTLSEDIPIFPIDWTIRIFSNPEFLNLVKEHDKWQICYENLLYSLDELEILPNINITGLKDIEFLKGLFSQTILAKTKVIELIGETRDIRGAEVLLDYLGTYESLQYKYQIEQALKTIGFVAEDILLKFFLETSDLNVRSLLCHVLGTFNSPSAKSLMLNLLLESKDIGFKVSLLTGLLAYQDNELHEKLCEFFEKSDFFDQRIYLTAFSKVYSSPFEKVFTKFAQNNPSLTLDWYVEKIFKEASTSESIGNLLQLSKQQHLKNLTSLPFLLIQIGKKDESLHPKIVEALETLFQDDFKKIISYLLNLKSEVSAERILQLIEEHKFYKNQDLFFNLVSFGKKSLQPVLNALSRSNDIEYTTELIRIIGLLGFSDGLREFPECVYLRNETTLLPIISWAIYRMTLRKPDSLIDKINKSKKPIDRSLLATIIFRPSKIFIKALRRYRDSVIDTPQEIQVVITLLHCGDTQIIGRALVLLENEKEKTIRDALILTMSKIPDNDIKEYLRSIIPTEPLNERLFILSALAFMKDEESVVFWRDTLKILKNKEFLLVLPIISQHIPDLSYLDYIISVSNKVRMKRIEHHLKHVFSQDNIFNVLNRFHFLHDLPNIPNENQLTEFFEFLQERGAYRGFAYTEGTPSKDQKTKPISTVGIMYFSHQIGLLHHLADLIIMALDPLVECIRSIAFSNIETFIQEIKKRNDPYLYLLAIIAFKRIFSETIISFLTLMINDENQTEILRKYSLDAYLAQYRLNFNYLNENWRDLSSNNLLYVIRGLNPQNKHVRTLCEKIANEVQNPELKLNCALRSGDINLFFEVIREVFDGLSSDLEISQITTTIGIYGLSDLLDSIFEHYKKSESNDKIQSNSIRQSCLKAIERIGDIESTERLLELLQPSSILFSDNYRIKEIIKKFVSSDTLILVKNFIQKTPSHLESEFYFELILESRNTVFTDDLIHLFNEVEEEKLRWNKYKLEVFLRTLEESQIVELSNNENLGELKDTFNRLLHSTGKRKYIEEWLKEILSMEIFKEKLYFEISSINQREFLCHQIGKIPQESIKNGILEKINWNNDLHAVKCLSKIHESSNDPEIEEIIIQEVLEIII